MIVEEKRKTLQDGGVLYENLEELLIKIRDMVKK